MSWTRTRWDRSPSLLLLLSILAFLWWPVSWGFRVKSDDRVLVFGGAQVLHGTSSSKGWVSVLESELTKKNVSVFKAGHLQLSLADDSAVEQTLERFDEFAKDKPTVVVLLVGQDDLTKSVPVASHLLQMPIERLVVRALTGTATPPRAVVLAGTPVLWGEQYHGLNEHDKALEDFAAILKGVALAYKCSWLDLRSPLMRWIHHSNTANQRVGVLTYDGTTLNDLGHVALSHVVLTYFETKSSYVEEDESVREMIKIVEDATTDSVQEFNALVLARAEQEKRLLSAPVFTGAEQIVRPSG